MGGAKGSAGDAEVPRDRQPQEADITSPRREQGRKGRHHSGAQPHWWVAGAYTGPGREETAWLLPSSLPGSCVFPLSKHSREVEDKEGRGMDSGKDWAEQRKRKLH